MFYYADKEAYDDGDHEIHREDCPKLPAMERLVPIGEHRFGFQAMKEARKHFIQVNGCSDCMSFYHSSHLS